MFLGNSNHPFHQFLSKFSKICCQKILKWEKNKIENYVERVFTYRKEGPGPHSERLKGLTTLHASVDRQKLSLSHSSHIFTLPKLLYISGQASTYFGINFFHQILWEKVDSNVIFWYYFSVSFEKKYGLFKNLNF